MVSFFFSLNARCYDQVLSHAMRPVDAAIQGGQQDGLWPTRASYCHAVAWHLSIAMP